MIGVQMGIHVMTALVVFLASMATYAVYRDRPIVAAVLAILVLGGGVAIALLSS